MQNKILIFVLIRDNFKGFWAYWIVHDCKFIFLDICMILFLFLFS